MPEIKIIKCGEGLIQSLTELYDRVTKQLEENINYPKWRHKEYPSEGTVRAGIASGTLYALTMDGEPAGVFVLNDDPQGCYEKGDWSWDLKRGEYMVIHSLAVRPESQSMGYAGRMVEFAKERAAFLGYRGVRVDIVPGNLPAQRLYERHGFVCAGEYDLERGFDDIPTFILYEYNLD